VTATDFTSIDDATELVDTISAVLPTWLSYYTFDGQPHARPLSVDTFTIALGDVAAAKAALDALPDAIATTGYTSDGWRDLTLTDALRAWGWATQTLRDGAVLVGGIWGDVVFPANFAALLAIAPFAGPGGEPWVFGADRDTDPVFAVSFGRGRLAVSSDVDLGYRVH
jgi:hypothetical protein